MKKTNLTDEELVGKVAAHLDEGVEGIDPRHLEKLRRARIRALNAQETRRGWFGFAPAWLTPARFSLATVTLVAVSLFALNPKDKAPRLNPDDLDVITSNEKVEMIQDLDFYRWLEKNHPQNTEVPR